MSRRTLGPGKWFHGPYRSVVKLAISIGLESGTLSTMSSVGMCVHGRSPPVTAKSPIMRLREHTGQFYSADILIAIL